MELGFLTQAQDYGLRVRRCGKQDGIMRVSPSIRITL